MATEVNNQITDAVTQTNVKVLGEAPAMATGQVYQSAAQSIGLAMQNAVNSQQNLNITAQAATTAGVNAILSAAATSSSQTPDTMLSLLTALRATNAGSSNTEESS